MPLRLEAEVLLETKGGGRIKNTVKYFKNIKGRSRSSPQNGVVPLPRETALSVGILDSFSGLKLLRSISLPSSLFRSLSPSVRPTIKVLPFWQKLPWVTWEAELWSRSVQIGVVLALDLLNGGERWSRFFITYGHLDPCDLPAQVGGQSVLKPTRWLFLRGLR